MENRGTMTGPWLLHLLRVFLLRTFILDLSKRRHRQAILSWQLAAGTKQTYRSVKTGCKDAVKVNLSPQQAVEAYRVVKC
jgi:hypothetical protein